MFYKQLVKNFSRNIKQSLEGLGMSPHKIYHNVSVAELYELSMINNTPTDLKTLRNYITSTGALAAYSGTRTGRSPQDKRIVLDETTEKEIWWGNVNLPLSQKTFKMLESRALDYLSSRPRLYIVDGYAGWDKNYRIRVRVIACRAYHALFMRNMLIVPTPDELARDFSNEDPDYHIFNTGELNAGSLYEGVGSKTCIALNFSERKLVILGTQYAGEMKKGVFSIMNYLMPKRGILSMHSSANEGEKGDVSLFFGLSGTGKTTLSADVRRRLIGDDEHCWSDNGIFNIEGGCYAKCVALSREKEPEIYEAIRYGSVLENVKFKDSHTREVDYNDTSITENTRVAYPLSYIPGAKIPATASHPRNIIFLTCDAYGVLPPVSKLTHGQAMYHFISGYTAKVAGTEIGVKEPTSTFSACFGEAFLPLHPTVYAELLAKKMKQNNTNAWLVNTGWSGGRYGVGKRMDISTTRSIINAIHSGELEKQNFRIMPVFGLAYPESCPEVKDELLNPVETWQNKDEYHRILSKLAIDFQKNFDKYKDKANKEIIDAGPKLI